MQSFIEIPPSVPPDSGSPTNIDIPSGVALPMWAILSLLVLRELGLSNLLNRMQEGRQKSNESRESLNEKLVISRESLTEKVVTQVLEQYGELTAAVEKLTEKIEDLTEETKEYSELMIHHLKTLAERERLAIIAATRKEQADRNGSAN